MRGSGTGDSPGRCARIAPSRLPIRIPSTAPSPPFVRDGPYPTKPSARGGGASPDRTLRGCFAALTPPAPPKSVPGSLPSTPHQERWDFELSRKEPSLCELAENLTRELRQ